MTNQLADNIPFIVIPIVVIISVILRILKFVFTKNTNDEEEKFDDDDILFNIAGYSPLSNSFDDDNSNNLFNDDNPFNSNSFK
jgi:hypothetical protein